MFVSQFSHIDVDRDISTAILSICRETMGAIFASPTNEQNGSQTVRMDAAVLQTDTSSWRMDAKAVRTDVETV